jgi:hypothetical protein
MSGRIMVNYSVWGLSASVGLDSSADFRAGAWSTVIDGVLVRFNVVIGDITDPI